MNREGGEYSEGGEYGGRSRGREVNRVREGDEWEVNRDEEGE